MQKITPVFLGLIWAVLATSTPAAAPSPLITKGPYLQAPGTNTMTIMWESLTNHPGRVRYGLGNDLQTEVLVAAPEKVINRRTNAPVGLGKSDLAATFKTDVFYVYAAALTGLRPGATYAYRVEMDATNTPVRHFKTFSPTQKKVTFIAYGDTRTKPEVHAALARQFRQYAPDFILHTGDLVARGRQYDLWSKEFFTPLAEVMDEIPLLPVLGNHEDDGANYLAYFRLPGVERWYSADIGPVHVTALDYHSSKDSEPQFTYVRDDLLRAAGAPWRIILNHYPSFNLGGHATGWGHKFYLPLFHAARVDLVIAGHSHIYERFRPIVQKGAFPWPITHITTGGGGAPLTTSYAHPSLLAHARTNHFLVLEATAESLKGRCITLKGDTIDTFEIRKRGNQYGKEYAAQEYPEEPLKLTFDASLGFTGRLPDLPNSHAPAPVMLTLRPLEGADEPAEIEITLTPESTNHYELVEGPLKFITPTKAETNIWAHIILTGTNAIKLDGNRELDPRLIFQVRVRSGGTEVQALGGKSRLSVTASNEFRKLFPPPSAKTTAR